MAGKKEQLFNFLDERAFKPVLDADPGDYSSDDQRKLKDVQRATRSERQRYEDYSSAEELYRMFKDDLSSDAAKDVDRELNQLKLPTLDDVRGDFERKAKEVGVGS